MPAVLLCELRPDPDSCEYTLFPMAPLIVHVIPTSAIVRPFSVEMEAAA
jgi:hypothetical protein